MRMVFRACSQSARLSSRRLAFHTAWMIAILFLSGCSMADDPAATAYVTIDPAATDLYLKDLAEIARMHDLDPTSWSATPDNGPTRFVFEARGRALRIWSQNMLLSGHECPEVPNVSNDPGQFRVVVTPAMWLRAWGRAHELFGKVKAGLVSKGYVVTVSPSAPCAPDRPKIASTR
jgi:hypothetical protein